MIDQDVPRNGSRVTLLQWLQPNLQASPDALTVVNIADGASTAVGAPYIPPTPPGGSGPHSYTFLLFEQPFQWIIPSQYVTINPPADSSARIGFDITGFIAASGLGKPLAANYLRVLNGTAAETSSASTETFTAPTSTQSTASSAATSTSPMSSSAMASTTSEGGSATSAMASATASATDGAVAVRGNAKELLVGLAMGVVGAALWML
jgi:phosphatidylethanolamine-binding protein